MLFACLELICHILAHTLEHVLERSFFLRAKAAEHDAVDATALLFPSGKGTSTFFGDVESARTAIAARNARQEALALQRVEQTRHSRRIDGIEAGDLALGTHPVHRDIRKDARLALAQPQASRAGARRSRKGGRVAARAYSNLGQLFIDQDNAAAASGCARLAVRLAPADARTVALMDRLAKEHPEVAQDSDDHVLGELSVQGIPTSPSADVAICLLICASDAAAAGDRALAAEYTARANGLIGKEACSALIKMIREADNEGGADAQ